MLAVLPRPAMTAARAEPPLRGPSVRDFARCGCSCPRAGLFERGQQRQRPQKRGESPFRLTLGRDADDLEGHLANLHLASDRRRVAVKVA